MARLFSIVLAILLLSACGANASSPRDQGSTSPAPVSAQSLHSAEEVSVEIPEVQDSPSAEPEPEQTIASMEETSEAPLSSEAVPQQDSETLKITAGDYTWTATFADNRSAEEFRQLLSQGSLTIEMEDYGGFEKVGPLGTTLTRSDTQITTAPGDVILYQGNQITIYYGVNSWNFTKLATIDDPTNLAEGLGDGTVLVTFSLE